MSHRTEKQTPQLNSILLRPLKLRVSVFLVISAVYLIVCLGAKVTRVYYAKGEPLEVSAPGSRKQSSGRNLLGIIHDNATKSSDTYTNCTKPAILDFPADIFSDAERRHGAVVLHALLAFYLFTLLAIVCDNYFVPSIKKITKVLNMSKDVAGATFMAAATSSPELFINSVGTFVTEGDLGIGTIVGSGVFNILAVPACCGLFAGKNMRLDWWPLTRDSIAYAISVILLILTLADEKVSWQEAFILVVCYIGYILLMCFNKPVEKWITSYGSSFAVRDSEESQLLTGGYHKNSVYNQGYAPTGVQHGGGGCDSLDTFSEDEDGEEINLWHWPSDKGLLAKGWWIMTWPISVLLYLTIPDCRQPTKQRLYPITFSMCILYIGSAAYVVAWMITVIGDTARIPDSVMGLTFLAAGTSLPEAVSSVIVTNQGYGSMGLSNSLGSNTFDILLCLGLPWLIKSVLVPAVPGHHFVIINSKGIGYSAISLISTLIILYILFACNKFQLDRKIGFLCLLTYVTFLIVASLNELNFFYDVNLYTCGW